MGTRSTIARREASEAKARRRVRMRVQSSSSLGGDESAGVPTRQPPPARGVDTPPNPRAATMTGRGWKVMPPVVEDSRKDIHIGVFRKLALEQVRPDIVDQAILGRFRPPERGDVRAVHAREREELSRERDLILQNAEQDPGSAANTDDLHLGCSDLETDRFGVKPGEMIQGGGAQPPCRRPRRG